jgi:hypothetical protein
MLDWGLSNQFMSQISGTIKFIESQSLSKIHFFSKYISEKMERKT